MMDRQFEILTADARNVINSLPEFHCVVTSPPYWKQRNYEQDSQLGQEEVVDDYIHQIMSVFSQIFDRLVNTGTVFVNFGDKYVNGSLLGIPWRFAIAMMDAGWVLRNDIIWHKHRIMPHSAKNRFTPSHEYVFFFTKQKTGYTFNSDAVREVAKWAHDRRAGKGRHVYRESRGDKAHTAAVSIASDGRRIRRSVWAIETSQTNGSHAATFPVRLPEICILAGSNEGDVILDPFSGTGTVGVAAVKNNRRYVGIDVNQKFSIQARKRIERVEIDRKG